MNNKNYIKKRLYEVANKIKRNIINENKELNKFRIVESKEPIFEIKDYSKNNFILLVIKNLRLGMPYVANNIKEYKTNIKNYTKDFNDFCLNTYHIGISLKDIKIKNISKKYNELKDKKVACCDISFPIFALPISDKEFIKDITKYIKNLMS